MPQPRTTSDVETPLRDRALVLNRRNRGTSRRVALNTARDRVGTAQRALNPRRRGRVTSPAFPGF